uniref:Ig-like domain-containing protein n=1 Tax=Cyprinus carpio TaxID=7962 RepID=A0A8C1T3Q6_CYPCA
MELSWFILTLLLTVCKAFEFFFFTFLYIHLHSLKSSTVTLTCEHDNSDHYRLFWYKQAKGTVDLSLMVFSASQNQANIEEPFKSQNSKYAATRPEIMMSTLQINKLDTKDSALYYCATSTQISVNSGYPAYFGNGTKLTVLDPDVTITEPTLKILNTTRCKEKVTLVCVAENFYPDHVSIKWTLGDKEITEDVATDPYATKDENTKMFNISSRLKVSKKEFTPKNTFRCTVTFNNSTHVSEKTVYITGTGGISLDIS